LYEQYGLVLKELISSCEFETPAALQSLMSDSRIMSDLILTMPWTFSKWFAVPNVDIFSELQLMEETDMLGKLELRLNI